MCIFWQLVVVEITQGGWYGGPIGNKKDYIRFFHPKGLLKRGGFTRERLLVHRSGLPLSTE